MTGLEVAASMSRAKGRSSAGPSEQLMPTTSAPIASRVTAAILGEVPRKVRPSPSNVIVAKTGRSLFSRAASTAALISARSVMVSTTMMSQPAASAARAHRAKCAYASSKDMVPRGFSSVPRGPMSPAT